jgi:Carboxypeptidase regulatory-like domain
VVDSGGAVVAGVEVRVRNAETGAAASARSNESGNYTVPYLLPGAYDLTAEFAGFKKMAKRGIEIRVNDVLNVNVQLEVGSATDTVEVKGGTPLLESSNVSIGQVMDQHRIENLPVQAGFQPARPAGKRVCSLDRLPHRRALYRSVATCCFPSEQRPRQAL